MIAMSTILIIEDEASIRKLAAANLKARGYEVFDVATAEEGLALLHRHGVALIVLDIKLPGMSGWQFLDASASYATVPVVVMTASGAEATLDARRHRSVEKILVKPFNVQTLVQTVRQALNQEEG